MKVALPVLLLLSSLTHIIRAESFFPKEGPLSGIYEMIENVTGGQNDYASQYIFTGTTVITSAQSGQYDLTITGTETNPNTYRAFSSGQTTMDLTLSDLGNITLNYMQGGNPASNLSTGEGGAIRASGNVSLINNKNITFIGNEGIYAGGAISANGEVTIQGNGNVLFQNNHTNNSTGVGGAIQSIGNTYITDNKDVSFLQNKSIGSLASGGGIDSLGAVYITGNENVTFAQDSSILLGGAITASDEIVIANNSGNVVFAGNTLKNGESNALTQDGFSTNVNNQLSANSGKSITFYDGNKFSGNLILNGYGDTRGVGTNLGTIEFSGGATYVEGIGTIDAKGDQAITTINKDLSLLNGTLKISQNAKVKVTGSFSTNSGTTLFFNLNNTTPNSLSALSLGSYNTPTGKVTITTEGGSAGNTYNLIDFGSTHWDSLADLSNNFTLDHSDYTEYHWDPSTNILSLTVIKTPPQPTQSLSDATIAAVPSALWSSSFTMNSVINSIDQRTLAPYYMPLFPDAKANLWVNYLGIDSTLNNRVGTTGTDFSANGFVIGSDVQICRSRLGISYGQTWGKNTYHGLGRIMQDTSIFAIYGESVLHQNTTNRWLLRYIAAYGRSQNHSKLEEALGKWHSNNWAIDINLNYQFMISEKMIVSPYIGLQWQYASTNTWVSQDNLQFNREHLDYLQANIGINTMYAITNSWNAYSDISVNPDLKRHNPQGIISGNTQQYNSFATNPGRVSCKATIGSTYALSAHTRLYGSYTIEAAEHSTLQSFQMGVSYAF